MATGTKSWASAVGSKPAEGAKPKPAPQAAEPAPAAQNGTAPAPEGGAAVKPEPKMNGSAAPRAGGAASVASSGVPASYEPMPSEIRTVTLKKPDADAKLGIRLAGDDRPRIVGLNKELIAAKSGGLAVNDVILTVNGLKAQGHARTTEMLKKAVGSIRVELFSLKLSAEHEADPNRIADADIAKQVAAVQSAAAAADGAQAPVANGNAEEHAAPPPRQNPWTGKAPGAGAARPASAAPEVLRRPDAAAQPPAAQAAEPPATPASADADADAPAPAPAQTAPAPAPAPSAPRVPAWQNPKATAAAVGAAVPQPSAAPSPAAPAAEAADAGASGNGGSAAAAAAPGGTRRGGKREEGTAWSGANNADRSAPASAVCAGGDASAPPEDLPDRPCRVLEDARVCSDCGKSFNVNDVASFNRHVCSKKGNGGNSASSVAGGSNGHPGAAPQGRGSHGAKDNGASAGGAQGGAGPGPSPPPPGHPFPQGVMPPVGLVWRYGGPMPQPGQQFQTELMLLQEMSPGGERMRAHRDALKARLVSSSAAMPSPGLTLDELEYSVRCMIVGGRFAGTQGIPESAMIGLIPDKYVQPPSPFRTIAEVAAGLPWLLRVHQSMQWVQQMPNGLMTVQRLVCPAASEMGGLAAPEGVLAIDWQTIEQVMARPDVQTDPNLVTYRSGMQGDPRFPGMGGPRAGAPGAGGAPGQIVGAPGAAQAAPAAAEGAPAAAPAEGGDGAARGETAPAVPPGGGDESAAAPASASA